LIRPTTDGDLTLKARAGGRPISGGNFVERGNLVVDIADGLSDLFDLVSVDMGVDYLRRLVPLIPSLTDAASERHVEIGGHPLPDDPIKLEWLEGRKGVDFGLLDAEFFGTGAGGSSRATRWS
jgi:hypothetical protein